MTAESQQIAIAEACGYELRPDGYWKEKGMVGSCGIPDYLHDLNACREFEKMIGAKWPTYCEILLRIVEPEPRTLEVCHYWNLLHATAAQRCEAFLKTIGKWTNDN